MLSNSNRGNCYGLKLPKYRLQLKKIVESFIIIFGILSFPMGDGKAHVPLPTGRSGPTSRA